MSKRIYVRLRNEDRERLEMIQRTHGISKSDAVRIAIVVMCRQLGYTTEIPNDLLKNKRNCAL